MTWVIYITIAVGIYLIKNLSEVDNISGELREKLLNMANEFKIPVTVHDFIRYDRRIGEIEWYKNKGRTVANIKLLKGYDNDFPVLAHELGHYIEIDKNNDDSEPSANRMGAELCKTLLTPIEQRIMKRKIREWLC